MIATATAIGEVGRSLWWPMMITLLGGVGLVATGLVLGVARRLGDRPLGSRSS